MVKQRKRSNGDFFSLFYRNIECLKTLSYPCLLTEKTYTHKYEIGLEKSKLNLSIRWKTNPDVIPLSKSNPIQKPQKDSWCQNITRAVQETLGETEVCAGAGRGQESTQSRRGAGRQGKVFLQCTLFHLILPYLEQKFSNFNPTNWVFCLLLVQKWNLSSILILYPANLLTCLIFK